MTRLMDTGDDTHRLLTGPRQEPVVVVNPALPYLVIESHLARQRRPESEGRVRERRQAGFTYRLPVISLRMPHSHNVAHRASWSL